MEYKILDSNLSDLYKISLCQKKAFPKSLFTALGNKYLMKMFEWYVTSEHTILIHIEENGACIGYCGGMINDGNLKMGSISTILQYTFKEAIIGVISKPWIIFHTALKNSYPVIFKNIKMKLGFNKKSAISHKNNNGKEYPQFGLIVIGVDGKYQGKGIGTQLLNKIELISKEKGIKSMYLSVFANNHQAIHTYEKNGWVKIIDAHNTQSIKMNKSLINP